MENKAKDWLIQNYHTPLTTIPVLLGIEEGEECWKDYPIEEILESYHQSQLKAELRKAFKAGRKYGEANEIGFDELKRTEHSGGRVTMEIKGGFNLPPNLEQYLKLNKLL